MKLLGIVFCCSLASGALAAQTPSRDTLVEGPPTVLPTIIGKRPPRGAKPAPRADAPVLFSMANGDDETAYDEPYMDQPSEPPVVGIWLAPGERSRYARSRFGYRNRSRGQRERRPDSFVRGLAPNPRLAPNPQLSPPPNVAPPQRVARPASRPHFGRRSR